MLIILLVLMNHDLPLDLFHKDLSKNYKLLQALLKLMSNMTTEMHLKFLWFL